MKSRMLLLLVVVLICFVSLLHAQQQSQTQTATQSPPITAAEPPSVDNQGIKNYLLGPGDVLDVRVFGQPDLGAMVDVDSEGNVSSLPFLESPSRAKCRTEKEVQRDISNAYSKYLKNPQVSVRISERKSR